MNIQDILVAFDGSENSLEACNVATILAKGYGSEITVVSAVPPLRLFSRPRLGTEYYSSLERNARIMIEKAVSSFTREGVKARYEILRSRSSVPESINNYAAKVDSDLVIAGTRGHGGFRRMLLGSVSSELVSHASSPVLVVRKRRDTDKARLDRILVATDGSKNALKAVGYAVSLAKTLKSELTIVYIIYMSPLDYSTDSTEIIGTVLKELREEGEKAVSEAALLAGESNVRVEVKIVENNRPPMVAITDLADKEKFDLIVLGTRGLGGFRRLILGSTANGVIHYAKCSVLVTR